MSSSKFEGIFAVAVTLLIVWLLYDNNKKSHKIIDLQKEIDENENLTKEIKKQLTELIQNNKEIDPKLANELGQIAALLEIKQDATAVMKLAKVIESLLKELFKGDAGLKEVAKKYNRKTPVFADYLEHAKNRQIITSEDFHLLSIMKIIRNEEAHELNVKKERSRMLASFIAGIGIILGLCRILKRKTIVTSIKGE